MDHLFNTFLHAIAWRSGSMLVHMIGLPVIIIFVGYGLYRFLRRR